MNRKSKDTIYEVGEIYMSGMNEQMARHFENVIQLRFSQVEGIVSVVSAQDQEDLYDELVYRAKVREFDYLALCSDEGVFETQMCIRDRATRERTRNTAWKVLVRGRRWVIVRRYSRV